MRLPASFGGIEFDVTECKDSIRRRIESNEYPNRDGGDLRDRGSEPRETSCEIVFWPRAPISGEQIESGLDHLDRFSLFFAETMRGRAQDFVHPQKGVGGYRARIESIEWTSDFQLEDIIRGTVVFLEDSTNPFPTVEGSARAKASGLAEAQVSIDNAEFQLAQVADPPDTSFLDTTEGFLGQWQEPDFLFDIAAQLGQATRLIETARDAVGTTDITKLQAFLALEQMAAAMREAAEAVRQDQPQLQEVEVQIDQPLRRFILGFYGATNAQTLFDQIMTINLIDDPGFVKQGTRILIPVEEVAPSVALQGQHR